MDIQEQAKQYKEGFQKLAAEREQKRLEQELQAEMEHRARQGAHAAALDNFPTGIQQFPSAREIDRIQNIIPQTDRLAQLEMQIRQTGDDLRQAVADMGNARRRAIDAHLLIIKLRADSVTVQNEIDLAINQTYDQMMANAEKESADILRYIGSMISTPENHAVVSR